MDVLLLIRIVGKAYDVFYGERKGNALPRRIQAHFHHLAL
jgi:hypothetical protein